MPLPGLTPVSGFDLLANVGAALQPIAQPGGDRLEEYPDSPTITFAEQCTIVHKFWGDWDTILANRMERGTYLTDGDGNITRVLTCEIQRAKPGLATLTITAESISFSTPPDEFDSATNEFNPALEKNPLFTAPVDFDAPYPAPSDGVHLTDIDVQNIKASLEMPQEAARTEATVSGNPYPPGSDLANLYTSLLIRLRRGEDTYYLAGKKVTYTKYYFAPQPEYQGGYTQDPADVIPATFATEGGLGETSIWDPSLSWLRLADEQEFNRTWFKLKRSWIAAPQGYWDPLIYPPA